VTPVNVPWTDVNSEAATVTAWHVPDRSEVQAGAALVDVETSKAALEIEAPHDGIVVQLVPSGADVQVGQPVAYVFTDMAAVESFDAAAAATPAEPVTDSPIRASDKARERATQLGIDLADVPGTGLITVKDVEAVAGAAAQRSAPSSERLPDVVAGDAIAQRLLIIGAGLGATQILDIIAEIPEQQAVGIIDDDPGHWGRSIRGIPVVGGSDRIGALWEAQAFDAAVISISTSVDARARLRDLCRAASVPLANVIDRRAKLATGVTIGSGNVICAFTHFGTETSIGDNNFFSAYNSYDHHNVLGSDISTGPGCMASGEVTIRDRVRMGTGVFIEPKLIIGQGSLVASGSILVRSVPDEHAVKTKVVTTTVVPLKR
jgi:acetyltransferase-like isoleucine patch superfamily enzyme